MTSAVFQCTALMGTGKKGVLKADAAGYYEVPLGALNYHNSEGAFYALGPAKKLFMESSAFMRRVKSGVLRGEYGHPKYLPGMSKRDFLMRAMTIDEKSVAFHIAEVGIDDDRVKDERNNPICAIVGRIKPQGPYGEHVAASLENGEENVCFSVRALTDDYEDRPGHVVKNILEIVTWDYVNEPGLKPANKYMAPALESFHDSVTSFTRDNLLEVKNWLSECGMSLEDDTSQAIQRALDAYRWENQTPEYKSGIILPPSARWTK